MPPLLPTSTPLLTPTPLLLPTPLSLPLPMPLLLLLRSLLLLSPLLLPSTPVASDTTHCVEGAAHCPEWPVVLLLIVTNSQL